MNSESESVLCGFYAYCVINILGVRAVYRKDRKRPQVFTFFDLRRVNPRFADLFGFRESFVRKFGLDALFVNISVNGAFCELRTSIHGYYIDSYIAVVIGTVVDAVTNLVAFLYVVAVPADDEKRLGVKSVRTQFQLSVIGNYRAGHHAFVLLCHEYDLSGVGIVLLVGIFRDKSKNTVSGDCTEHIPAANEKFLVRAVFPDETVSPCELHNRAVEIAARTF